MDPIRWDRVKAVLEAVLELPAEERAEYLDGASLDDPSLRDEVESLLAAGDQARDFLLLANAPLSGTVAGHYRIERRIGAGGMGEVYLATDTRLRRQVAVKTILPNLGDDEAARRRFVRETRHACSVSHPYVATVFDVVEHEDLLLLIMEYLEGRTFRQTIREERPSTGRILGWLVEIAEAVAAIHAAGLIHRDVKPSNVIVTESGHVKVMDFGLARRVVTPFVGQDSTTITEEPALTHTGATIGTPMYMAPEQLRGEPTDALSDQFALGIVAFEALHGSHPFLRSSVAESVSAILGEPPSTADGPGPIAESAALNDLLTRMLDKRPELRYPDVESVLVDLRAAAESYNAPVDRVRRTGPLLMGIAAALLVLVVGAAIAWNWLSQPPSWDRERYAIAVAPFENLTGEEAGALQAAMLADLLVKDLQGSYLVRAEGPDEIRLAGLVPTLPQKDAAFRIASTRETDYVVLGKLFREQGRYYATAEVKPTRQGRSELAPMRADGGAVLELAEQLATGLRQRLPDVSRLTALRDDRVDLGELTSSSDEARSAYEQGVTALRKGRINEAIEALDRAVEADPRFTLAFARLAEALDLAGYGLRSREAIERARSLAPQPSSRARERLVLQVDATWAQIFGRTDEWVEATHALVESFPDEPLLVDDYAQALREVKRFDEALDQIDRAVLLDARHPGLRLSRAELLRDLSRYDESVQTLNQAAALFQLVESDEGLARIDTIRGGVLQEQESYEAAVASYTSAAERYAAAGREISAAESWLRVTGAWLEKGDLEFAEERIAAAEEIARREGNLRILCEALTTRGALQYYRKDFDTAIEYYREAVDRARQVESRKLMVRPIANLTGLLVWQRRIEEALPLLEESRTLAREFGKRDMLQAALFNTAEIAAQQGDLDGAVETFLELVSDQRERPERMILIGNMGLGWIYYERGQLAKALEQLDAAVDGSRETERPMDLGRALQNRARVRSALGRFEEAEADLAEAVRLAEVYPDLQNSRWLIEATIAFHRGNWARTIDLLSDHPDAPGVEGQLLKCTALQQLGRTEEAIDACRGVVDSDQSTPSEKIQARAWLAHALVDAERLPDSLVVAQTAIRTADGIDLLLPLARAAAAIVRLPAARRPADWETLVQSGADALERYSNGLPPNDRASAILRPDVQQLTTKLERAIE